MVAHAVGRGGGQRRDPAAGPAPYHPAERATGQSTQDAAQQVDAKRDGADRNLRGEPAEPCMHGIARRMADPQRRRRHQEQPIVLEEHGGRRGQRVHAHERRDKRGESDQGGSRAHRVQDWGPEPRVEPWQWLACLDLRGGLPPIPCSSPGRAHRFPYNRPILSAREAPGSDCHGRRGVRAPHPPASARRAAHTTGLASMRRFWLRYSGLWPFAPSTGTVNLTRTARFSPSRICPDSCGKRKMA